MQMNRGILHVFRHFGVHIFAFGVGEQGRTTVIAILHGHVRLQNLDVDDAGFLQRSFDQCGGG